MRDKFLSLVVKLQNDASGATAIEYGLIAAGIAVVIITAISLAGGALTNTFTSISNAL
ncbi:MAG: Flp family type IVb pilin [Alphaproteobacteria bacterium]|nr:Flp family type IVb pilin [Alphaproteobacteria bacterium]